MRIVYAHYLIDDDHPAARMVAAIASELRTLGHDVKVHASRWGEPAKPSGGPAKAPSSSLRGRLWFAKMMWRDRKRTPEDLKAIREFAPDVVLARQDAYRTSMVRAAKMAGVPLVTYADCPVAHEIRMLDDGSRWHPSGMVERLERSTLSASRRVITVSRPAAEILERYRLEVPIEVVPNGVHPERFPEIAPEERLAKRRSLGIEAPIVAGFQGTFKAFHGIDRLRDLILSTTDRQDVHWLMVGDGPELPALREAAAAHPRCTFLGRRPPETVPGFLALMDVAVAPHEVGKGPFYFCPLKLLEYAAAGCAILASDQGDIPSLLDDGRAAVLLREPGIEAWRVALDRLLSDGGTRERLGRSAREFVLANRTWKRTAERVGHALALAIGTSPTASRETLSAESPRMA